MTFRSEVTNILLSDVLTAAEKLGLTNIAPTVLNDAGNLIVHLVPYPIVARVAKRLAGHDLAYWREIEVAKHLMARGVPVVSYTNLVPPGPHKVGDTWMTLWEYVTPVQLEQLCGKQAIDMVNVLVKAMSDFEKPLPPLGVWRNVNQAACGVFVVQAAFVKKFVNMYCVVPLSKDQPFKQFLLLLSWQMFEQVFADHRRNFFHLFSIKLIILKASDQPFAQRLFQVFLTGFAEHHERGQ